MDQLFDHAVTLRRLNRGPFAPYLAQLEQTILEDLQSGYSRWTLRIRVWVLAGFGDWLDANEIEVKAILPETIREFLKCRFRVDDGRNNFALALPRLLIRLGAISKAVPAARPADEVILSYERYLSQERGLTESTVRNYAGLVRMFLEDRFGPGVVVLSSIEAADIPAFQLRFCRSFSHGRVLLLASALRCFFRYLLLRGETSKRLSGAVQKAAEWRLQGLPKALEPEQVKLVLNHCQRKSAVGRRDYAILLLLARLGLRGGEVARLRLDSIDWENGEIILHGKRHRIDRLPMPRDVGKAIVAYLKRDRPVCSSRCLFVRMRAPYEGFKSCGAVADVVRRALRRAALEPPRMGSHLLRHGLAKQMLRRGASLSEIGQILRHQQVDTTAIYAKVDLDALRPLALPWPGGRL